MVLLHLVWLINRLENPRSFLLHMTRRTYIKQQYDVYEIFFFSDNDLSTLPDGIFENLTELYLADDTKLGGLEPA